MVWSVFNQEAPESHSHSFSLNTLGKSVEKKGGGKCFPALPHFQVYRAESWSQGKGPQTTGLSARAPAGLHPMDTSDSSFSILMGLSRQCVQSGTNAGDFWGTS